jgi:sirohydrochlorin ferrochelatase
MKRAVVLVDHGSRAAEANAVLDEVAALLRRRLPERIVEVAHMELAPPTLAEAVARCVAAGAREVLVHPYFLAPGAHATRDVPAQAAAAAARHPGVTVRVSPPLGAHEGIVDAILARLAEA